MAKSDLTQEELNRVLRYDPETGAWVWLLHDRRPDLVDTSPRAGVAITVNGTAYKPNRLAWLYMTGEHPSRRVERINRIPKDDRWCNLRLGPASGQELTHAELLSLLHYDPGNRHRHKTDDTA